MIIIVLIMLFYDDIIIITTKINLCAYIGHGLLLEAVVVREPVVSETCCERTGS